MSGGNLFIRSLTFKTNPRTFGPFRVEEGKRFSFSAYPIHEIVGFHGRSGFYLDSIGLHLSPTKPRTGLPKDEIGCQGIIFLVGPWGGNDAITVVYNKHGVPFEAEKHGRGGGGKTAKVMLQYPDEFLINISGHYGPINAQRTSDPYIRSLTFQSNRRTFGPFGVEEGKRFNFSANPIHEIVGFHGRSGFYLDSIGLHLALAKPRTLLPKDEIGWQGNNFLVGPWGGNGGTNWDDGIFKGVREITLVYGSCIDVITVVYDKHCVPFEA